jgi:hypothetical protein
MSLDTKRAEIRKLEERALEREQALRASEAALEADALKSDAFLKENDERVQEAIRKAEQEAKLKQEKVGIRTMSAPARALLRRRRWLMMLSSKRASSPLVKTDYSKGERREGAGGHLEGAAGGETQAGEGG